jgi:hypothetical protein
VVCLEADVGEEGPVARGVRSKVLEHAVDEVLGGVELRRHRRLAAVVEPVDAVGVREIALGWDPVVGAGVALHERAVEAAAVGKVVRLRPDVPLAGHVGAIAALL